MRKKIKRRVRSKGEWNRRQAKNESRRKERRKVEDKERDSSRKKN